MLKQIIASTCSHCPLKVTYIALPIKNKKLDLEYMENYIYKLEKGCINDLNKTLSSEGSLDTTISEEELSFLNQPPITQPKKLEELFVSETGDVDLQQKDIDGKGEYFVNSGLQNYGIKGRTSRPAKIFNSNTITIDFFGNAYYRAFKYKMATHNHVFSLSGDIIKNEKVGLYLVSQMFYFKKVFSYNEMATWNKLKKLTLNIPITSNGSIDYDYMERYISIIEKMTLKNVTDWEKLNY